MRLVPWKSGNAIAVCAIVIAIGLGRIGAAQDLQQADKKAEQKAPPAAQSTPKPSEDAAPKRSGPFPAPRNVRVDITITDQAGTETPLKKTLTVIVADNLNGSVRSKVTVAVPTHPPGPDPKNYSYEDLPLNVDVRPEVTADPNKIRVWLILNYETFYASKTTVMPATRSVVTVNQHVTLENGKPTTVSQSADAATDRKVSVELKATILP
jgi:hypothetical protein